MSRQVETMCPGGVNVLDVPYVARFSLEDVPGFQHAPEASLKLSLSNSNT